ncbi:MAG: hypothetical protein GWP91_19295 [Rhodobacterales bacterium]|nr:hypothetical protein [Rhodobacterales bacterium]
METKVWWGKMVPIGVIQVGPMSERLIKFYAMFGVTEQEKERGKWRIWTPEEVTIILGTGADPDHPTPREIGNMTRTRRRLVDKGLLEKVERYDPYEGVPRYSWRHTPPPLSEPALKVLNRLSNKVTWCNREDAVKVKWSDRLGHVPLIVDLSYYQDEVYSWLYALSDLLDFRHPEVWEFWTLKAPKAVSGKKHPLTKIADRDFRLMIGMLSLEDGLKRNLDSNLGWRPKDPIAWTLRALSKQVGLEPPRFDKRQGCTKDPQHEPSHAWATHLAILEGGCCAEQRWD